MKHSSLSFPSYCVWKHPILLGIPESQIRIVTRWQHGADMLNMFPSTRLSVLVSYFFILFHMKQINSSNVVEVWNVFYHEFSQYIQLMLIWKKTSLNLALRKQPQRIVTFIHLEQNLQSHSNSFFFLNTFMFFKLNCWEYSKYTLMLLLSLFLYLQVCTLKSQCLVTCRPTDSSALVIKILF